MIWRGGGRVTVRDYKTAWYIAAKPWREKIAQRYGFDLGDQGTLGLVLAPEQPAADVVAEPAPERKSRKQRRAERDAAQQPVVEQQVRDRSSGKHAAIEPDETAADSTADSTAVAQADPATDELVDEQVERRPAPVDDETDLERTQPQIHIVGSSGPSKAEVYRFITSEYDAGRTPTRQRIIEITGVKPNSLSSYLTYWKNHHKLTEAQVDEIRAA
jgi:hypothetical protein